LSVPLEFRLGQRYRRLALLELRSRRPGRRPAPRLPEQQGRNRESEQRDVRPADLEVTWKAAASAPAKKRDVGGSATRLALILYPAGQRHPTCRVDDDPGRRLTLELVIALEDTVGPPRHRVASPAVIFTSLQSLGATFRQLDRAGPRNATLGVGGVSAFSSSRTFCSDRPKEELPQRHMLHDGLVAETATCPLAAMPPPEHVGSSADTKVFAPAASLRPSVREASKTTRLCPTEWGDLVWRVLGSSLWGPVWTIDRVTFRLGMIRKSNRATGPLTLGFG